MPHPSAVPARALCGTHRAASAAVLLAVSLLAVSLLAGACSPADESRFASPSQTWNTYRQAVADGDAASAWTCFSASHQTLQYGGDLAAWQAEMSRRGDELKRENKRREIEEERVLNKRLAYLLFDAGTLPSDRVSPFAYFLREEGGWKMTTHLDTVFHHELERAIARNEYHLPQAD